MAKRRPISLNDSQLARPTRREIGDLGPLRRRPDDDYDC
jgi:hypothetical protein